VNAASSDVPASILVVDDDAPMRRTLQELLSAHGFHTLASAGAEDAIEILQSEPVDLVITDLRMPGMKGDALLREVRRTFPEIPVIAVTAFGSVQDAVELTRAGAVDYLEKPFQTRALLDAVSRALEDSAPRRQQARLRRDRGEFLQEFVGASTPMQQLFERIARVAHSPAPVLITGETGTGKELIARAIHRASERHRMVVINCGAIPADLLESELFGHLRGAFTGAMHDKEGLFPAANGGTLFLDEIGELPLPLQPKLLRAIETGEIRAVGAVEPERVDVRILAATHRDLEEAVAEGTFREDLFWRLRVLHLEAAPLRERAEDIPLLADAFLAEASKRTRAAPVRLRTDAGRMLREYHWPGNVRQLRNVLEAALTFAPGDEIRREDLPLDIRRSSEGRELIRSAAERGLTLADLERDYIFEILRRAGGNKTRAAELLGLPRRTLYRRLEEYAAEVVPPGHVSAPD
jgi:two-component system response regulator AtoC